MGTRFSEKPTNGSTYQLSSVIIPFDEGVESRVKTYSLIFVKRIFISISEALERERIVHERYIRR